MEELVKEMGKAAFIFIIAAVGVFFLKKRYPQIRKYHPYLGACGIICGTFHGIGMLYYYTEFIGRRLFILGIISLSILWLIGAAALGMKKFPPKMKGKFFKVHKYLGMSVFVFIILHVVLAS